MAHRRAGGQAQARFLAVTFEAGDDVVEVGEQVDKVLGLAGNDGLEERAVHANPHQYHAKLTPLVVADAGGEVPIAAPSDDGAAVEVDVFPHVLNQRAQ
eukprot:8008628-Pyramimonas_sp.AAC.1